VGVFLWARYPCTRPRTRCIATTSSKVLNSQVAGLVQIKLLSSEHQLFQLAEASKTGYDEFSGTEKGRACKGRARHLQELWPQKSTLCTPNDFLRLRRLLHPRTSSGSIPRSQAQWGHGPIIVLVMALVRQNGESSLINSVISNLRTFTNQWLGRVAQRQSSSTPSLAGGGR